MKIKTRFSPSPTGYLHVGGARTALYSWLFSRIQGGDFVLRIEDSDMDRSTPLAIEGIIEAMNWLTLHWDEGPYLQTKRLERYNTLIDDILSKGIAYKCYCSKERLKTLRQEQMAYGEKPRYDGRCRNSQDYHATEESYVVRFRNPKNGSVIFNDLIRGPIEFSNKELDDLIIRRTDGSPTYNFCVVVDDYDMSITHVIRGEDHINNTPRQINILKALGAPIPEYAHVSMILGDDGKKLSKRHSSLGVMQFRDDGFLPEALLNCLVRMGWSHGDQEIFSLDDMKQFFSLQAVSKSASIFNKKKLLWLNHYYINNLPVEDVAAHLVWHMEHQGINTRIGPQLPELVKLMRKNCKTLKEMAASSRYFYEDFTEFEVDSAKKYLHPVSKKILKKFRDKLIILPEWTLALVRAMIEETALELNVSMEKIGMPLRVAITGSARSPALDVTLHAVGQLRSLARINLALKFISNSKM